MFEQAPRKNGRVFVIKEVKSEPYNGGWLLCFQKVRYVYDNGEVQEGYRFIWRRPDGSLQAARGQARIPSLKTARVLMAQSEKEGWGQDDAEATGLFG